MDGFALRAADTPGRSRSSPASPRAGRRPARSRAGEAMGIATGGVVPEGADAVVPIEHVTDEGDGVVVPTRPSPPATTSGRAEATSSRASRCSPRGTLLSPSRLAALAAAGVAEPAVRAPSARRDRHDRHRAPAAGRAARRRRDLRVERRDARSAARPRRERSSSRARPRRRRRGVAPRGARRGLEADVLVTVGRRLGRPARPRPGTLAELGAEEVFWGVAMRPGKPLSFAVRGDTLVFGLPGNPVSSLVGSAPLRPARDPRPPGVARPRRASSRACWATPARRHPGRDDYQRARLEEVGRRGRCSRPSRARSRT